MRQWLGSRRRGRGARRRHHDRHVLDGLRTEFHHAGLKLRVDSTEQRTRIQIKQRAIGADDPACLRPGRQGIDSALLQRLDDLDRREYSGGQIRLGQIARGSEVPKQVGHFRVIAGRH